MDTAAEGSNHAGGRNGTIRAVATLRLFASAREAAGTGRDDVVATTVGELLAIAGQRYGATFVQVLESCKVWVNGEEASADTVITATDEVAVLPPVSGGAFGFEATEIGHDETGPIGARRVAAAHNPEERDDHIHR